MIVSHAHFMLLVSLATAGLCGPWFVVDVVRLTRVVGEELRARREAKSGPLSEKEEIAVRERHDRIFGPIMGLVMAVIGIIGVLLFYLGG